MPGTEFTLFIRSKKWIQLELSSRWEWADRRRARGFVKRWGALFDAYGKGRQWFGVVELGASIAAAVLAGLVPLDRGDGAVCQDLQVVSAVAAVAFLASVVLLRPYGAPMDERLAKGNAAATAASSVLGVFGIDTVILTAIQAILNGLGAIFLIAALAVDGNVFSALRGVVVTCVGSKQGHPTATAAEARLEGGHDLRMRRFVVGGRPRSAVDQRSSLENLISIICEAKTETRSSASRPL